MVQVNPAPFHQVKIMSDPQLIANGRRVPIGTQVQFNFTLVDRYGNNINTYTREKPHAGSKIADMVQVVHWDRKPVKRFVRAITPLMYQANFTTYYVGAVGLVVPFTSSQISTQTFQQTLANITFELPGTLQQIPSAKTSYAFLRQRSAQAGSLV